MSAEFCRFTKAGSLTLARFGNSSVLSSANPTLAILLSCGMQHPLRQNDLIPGERTQTENQIRPNFRESAE